MVSTTLKRGERYKIHIVAEPGIQGLCRIFGIVALYDPTVIDARITTSRQRITRLELVMNFEESARANLLAKRLQNLVEVRDARLIP